MLFLWIWMGLVLGVVAAVALLPRRIGRVVERVYYGVTLILVLTFVLGVVVS